MLEFVLGGIACLLVLGGLAIMIGPTLLRARRRHKSLSSRSEQPFLPPSEAALHPTTGRALSAATRLIDLLADHGPMRQANRLRVAALRLHQEEGGGIHAMREALAQLSRVRLSDAQDQEIMLGLIRQIRRHLDDRAEQLELLPRR
ncbi:MAG: hypothetical protein ACREP9_05365 [Candidatus Dormibacteraceae bacterium]